MLLRIAGMRPIVRLRLLNLQRTLPFLPSGVRRASKASILPWFAAHFPVLASARLRKPEASRPASDCWEDADAGFASSRREQDRRLERAVGRTLAPKLMGRGDGRGINPVEKLHRIHVFPSRSALHLPPTELSKPQSDSVHAPVRRPSPSQAQWL